MILNMKIPYSKIRLLFHVYCFIILNSGQVEETIFDKENHGIEDIANYSFPSDTTEIYFDENNITKVPSGVFKNMPNLLEIRLGKNIISTIDENAFRNVTSLEWLYLSNNNLTCISKNMFAGLSQLRLLSLRQNYITFIESQSLGMMNNLAELRLSRNRLKSLSQSIFDEIEDPDDIILSLKNNPLKCNSRLYWVIILDWIQVVDPNNTFCKGQDGQRITLLEHGYHCLGMYTIQQ